MDQAAELTIAASATTRLDAWRRRLQLALGAVWLLDAALQFQPFMFGHGFAAEILKPTAEGNPQPIARPILWSAQVVLWHPQLWNAVFAVTQLLLALGLFWRRTVKPALAGTVAWSLLVWWLGEGLGGVLVGAPAPLMGAPGAVILYALLALLLWPRGEGGSVAEASLLGRAAPAAWLVLLGTEAYFTLLPANDSPTLLRGMLSSMADGEPHPIAALDRNLAHLVGHLGPLGSIVGALLALCALAGFLPARPAKLLLGLTIFLSLALWVGQDFGAIFTGQGTDPNSGPLLVLLALAYWPLTRDPRPATAPPRRRMLALLAAAGVVAASSAAAAAGLTSTSALVSASPPLSRVSPRLLGPGPVVGRYALGGYRIVFRDSPNRARTSGPISVELSRGGRPIEGATVTLAFRSLDMNMGPLHGQLDPAGRGRYTKQTPLLGMGGRWRLTLTVKPPHGRQLTLKLTDLIGE